MPIKSATGLGSFLLILAVVTVSQERPRNPTLAEVLTQNSVPVAASIPNLNLPITSYATLDEDEEFVIAYYVDDLTELLRPPLYIARFKKATGHWEQVSHSKTQLKVSDIEHTDMPCLGSVLKIDQAAGRYYLTLHWNPSAGCFIVLNNDLSVGDAHTGGIAGEFDSGLLLLDGNEIHFADVHPATLYLYDPASHKQKLLYPPQNDLFRRNFSTRLEKVIFQDRCRENNWACDPERFTSDLDYPITVNNRAKTLAFGVRFEPEGFVPHDEAQDSGAWDDELYVYIFQLEPFRWREFLIYDLKPKFGTDSLQELISPMFIERVFATRASN